MKVSMQLTLDGLVRALRGHAHALAEAAEGGYLFRGMEPGALVVRQAHHEGCWDAASFDHSQKGISEEVRHEDD